MLQRYRIDYGVLLAIALCSLWAPAQGESVGMRDVQVQLAQTDPAERGAGVLSDEGPDLRRLREGGPQTSLTITPSFAARYRSNVYDTRRGRIGGSYVEPSLLAFMRTPLDEAGRSGVALGAYVDQQVFGGRAARDAGYTLLRAIVQYDFSLGPWEIGVRYAPSITFEGDTQTKDYIAHDLRVSMARDYDPSRVLGLSANQLRLEPRLTLLRRMADRDAETKIQLTGSVDVEFKLDAVWSMFALASVQGARFDRIAGGARQDLWVKLEPRIVFAPPDANYSLGAALGIGKRFSNDPALRSVYLEAGGGGDARMNFSWRLLNDDRARTVPGRLAGVTRCAPGFVRSLLAGCSRVATRA